MAGPESACPPELRAGGWFRQRSRLPAAARSARRKQNGGATCRTPSKRADRPPRRARVARTPRGSHRSTRVGKWSRRQWRNAARTFGSYASWRLSTRRSPPQSRMTYGLPPCRSTRSPAGPQVRVSAAKRTATVDSQTRRRQNRHAAPLLRGCPPCAARLTHST